MTDTPIRPDIQELRDLDARATAACKRWSDHSTDANLDNANASLAVLGVRMPMVLDYLEYLERELATLKGEAQS
jgi:hypothetical protein